MKKELIVGLCMVMTMTIVGCSSNKKENTNNNVNSSVQSNVSNNNESLSNSEENTSGTIYIGKVKNIVGNQVEVELAKNVEDLDVNNYGGAGSSFEEFDLNEAMENGLIGEDKIESIDEDAYAAISDSMEELAEGENEVEELELQYTGESKSFTIPAGANIFDYTNGSEGKVSSIKKGAIVQIVATESEGSSTASRISILE